ncbi:S-adenosyl-L-methionine-dependent methyltransferase [Colletotrichum acutatum]|uniref:S-adenosyl-L-methionine-dependent methyltransferase n=1 Tax=Glomerella acutata TaxID=27357 RepID=A0AAD8XA81_GLOAC|nr:S-adenosyl-L-methionine-dependent methyltransferase [Colletotrichum acutatum]KAK1710577.1 S-adenosyl-L-methionine-dependent methyltransferase [Colletotrichum acutatum]
MESSSLPTFQRTPRYCCSGSSRSQKILDVGTGTGAWAIEVGESHPHALVVGIDLSPIQPQHVPPNVEFQIDDFNEPWTFKDNSLDYINMRFLAGSVRDWNFLVGEAYRCLKEGGILESSEPSFLIQSDDGTVNARSSWYQWSRVFEQYGAQIGQTFSVVQEGIQKRALEEAHFSDIRELNYKIPIGRWPRDEEYEWLGRCAQSAIEKDALGFLLRPSEMGSGLTHPWFWFKKVWGRKMPSSSVVQ